MTSDCGGSSLSETLIYITLSTKAQGTLQNGEQKEWKEEREKSRECYPLHVIEAFTKQGLLVEDQDSQYSSPPLAEKPLAVDGYYGIESFFLGSVAFGRLPGIHPVIGPTIMLIWVALIGCGGLNVLKRREDRIKLGRGMCWEC